VGVSCVLVDVFPHVPSEAHPCYATAAAAQCEAAVPVPASVAVCSWPKNAALVCKVAAGVQSRAATQRFRALISNNILLDAL
jgi:hypothetical protein